MESFFLFYFPFCYLLVVNTLKNHANSWNFVWNLTKQQTNELKSEQQSSVIDSMISEIQ